MNDPVLPDLPAGFYLAPVNGFAPTIFELRGGCWYDDRGSWRSDPRIALNTVHAIPALLSAAGEQDALWADWCDSLAEVATLELVNETMMRRAEEAEEERDEALAELAEARVVLTKLEWWHDDREHVCMSCHSLRSDGHAPDCSLAAALAKAKS